METLNQKPRLRISDAAHSETDAFLQHIQWFTFVNPIAYLGLSPNQHVVQNLQDQVEHQKTSKNYQLTKYFQNRKSNQLTLNKFKQQQLTSSNILTAVLNWQSAAGASRWAAAAGRAPAWPWAAVRAADFRCPGPGVAWTPRHPGGPGSDLI